MKIKITQDKRKAGLLGGKTEWCTVMKVTASEEEKAIVSACNIGDFDVAELPNMTGGEDRICTVNELISSDTVVLSPNQWHANNSALRMRGAAGKLKELLDEVTADQTGEFEL